MKTLLIALFLSGCVAHTDPYLVEYRVGDFHAGAGVYDGPDPSKVLEVVNPRPYPVKTYIKCVTGDKTVYWTPTVAANSFVMGFAQVMNWDVITNVCEETEWERVR